MSDKILRKIQIPTSPVNNLRTEKTTAAVAAAFVAHSEIFPCLSHIWNTNETHPWLSETWDISYIRDARVMPAEVSLPPRIHNAASLAMSEVLADLFLRIVEQRRRRTFDFQRKWIQTLTLPGASLLIRDPGNLVQGGTGQTDEITAWIEANTLLLVLKTISAHERIRTGRILGDTLTAWVHQQLGGAGLPFEGHLAPTWQMHATAG